MLLPKNIQLLMLDIKISTTPQETMHWGLKACNAQCNLLIYRDKLDIRNLFTAIMAVEHQKGWLLRLLLCTG